MSGYLLGLDLGTSSVKAVLGTPQHGVVAIAERCYPMHRPEPGWAQHDPADWVRAVAGVIAEISAKAGLAAGSISAVCIVGQRDVAALIDRDGHSLCPCIHWTDRRDPAETEELYRRLGRERFLATSGTVPIPGLVLPNLVWARRHEPDIWGRVFAALQPKDYIAHRLTGEVATDRTSPTRSLLNDWRTEDWCEETCVEAGVPRSILPEVRYDPWEIRATLDRRAERVGLAAGTLLVAGGGDDPSAALGCGVVEPGEVSVGAGSSMSWRVVSEHPTVTPGSPLGVLPHVVPGRYLHEMVAVGTGTSFRWFREAMGSAVSPAAGYDALTAEAARIARGADGLLFFPYVEGASLPHDDDRVRAAFFGIGPQHRSAHLVRAILEGIAYQYPPLLELIRAAGHDVGTVTISDGEARSPVWNQIKAHVLGMPLRVAVVPEAPAVGAAILAGMATGDFPSAADGVAALAEGAATTEPSRSGETDYEIHRARWEVVRSHVFAATEAFWSPRIAADRTAG